MKKIIDINSYRAKPIEEDLEEVVLNHLYTGANIHFLIDTDEKGELKTTEISGDATDILFCVCSALAVVVNEAAIKFEHKDEFKKLAKEILIHTAKIIEREVK